jgi:hypothetical protein
VVFSHGSLWHDLETIGKGQIMEQWKLDLWRKRRAQEQWELFMWAGALCIALVVLFMLYRRLGRWQGIKQRVAQALSHGIPRHIRRDLRQGTIIAVAVLAALFAWSIIR